MSGKTKFVEMVVEGLTEHLKPCPNPLCKNEEITLLRQIGDGIAQCMVVCKPCKMTSPRSLRVPVDKLDDEMLANLNMAVVHAWNRLDRYSIGVKFAHPEIPQKCPWCGCTDVSVLPAENEGKGYAMVMCLCCLLSGAATSYTPDNELQKKRAMAQAVFAWNMLGITDRDNVE